ncbi:MAG: hypothetical protein HYY17_09880 [Planctomycetes bacterium]|nr:hypothetical protein [Planctomycetota bacterium]
MGYERAELVTIGERFNTDSLLEWSGQIAQAAKQDLARLKGRGLTEKLLAEIETSREEVRKLNLAQEKEKKDVSTLAIPRRAAIAAGLDWREEVRGLSDAVFDSEPDIQARFRTGVKASHSIPKLITEIGLLIGAAREHLPALKGVGADAALIARGEKILRDLQEVQKRQTSEKAQSSGAGVDLFHAQGVLYTRSRFVVRIAQVEFRKDPNLIGKYSYAALRRQEAAAEGRRGKAVAVKS